MFATSYIRVSHFRRVTLVTHLALRDSSSYVFFFISNIIVVSEPSPILRNSSVQQRKPALMHALRVGMYLYGREYSREIILAGFLHDAFEWAGIDRDILQSEFGDEITRSP